MRSAVIVEGDSTYVYCDDLVRGRSVITADKWGSREGQGQRRGGRWRRLGHGTGDRRAAGGGGAKVAVLDLPTSDGAAVAKELGAGASFHPCDAIDSDGAETALAAGAARSGALHIAG